jgi:GH24 family phage-related lysozyme (muramidase)
MRTLNITTGINILKNNKKRIGAISIAIMIGILSMNYTNNIEIEKAKAQMLLDEAENTLIENKEIIYFNQEAVESNQKIEDLSLELKFLHSELSETTTYNECVEAQLDRLATGMEVDLEYCETKQESFTEEVSEEPKKETNRDIDAPIKNHIAEPSKMVGDEYVIEKTMEFLRHHEGVRYTAYWDVKQYSICYGTRSVKGATANKEECEKILRERVQSELLRINRLGDNLPANKKVALISFFYNVGYKIEILNYARKGDDASVVYLMSLYNKAGGKYLPGLQKRRNAEIAVYKNENALTFAK